MKSSSVKALFPLLFFLTLTSVYSQSVEWKHYEYPDINLQFDLPADYEFEYPDDERLAFSGHNSLTTFYFERIDTAITTEEQRKEMLYRNDISNENPGEDPNFKSGVLALGYLYVSSVFYIHELEEPAIAMVLSDPNNNKLNFFIFLTYGGEGNTDSPAYDQARTILMKFGPIKE